MTRRLVVASLALALSGCFRLTDPFYAFKALRADDPESPGNSLVLGTILVGTSSSIDTVRLRRVRPRSGDGMDFQFVTEAAIFRAFRTRPMKGGNFLMELPPGVYEVAEFEGGNVKFHPDDSARKSSRFTITRPGIFDLGVIRIESSFWTPYGSISWEAPKDRAERAQIVRDAVKGTAWERFTKDRPAEGPSP